MTTIEKPRPVARPEEKPEADGYDLSKIQERHPDWPKLELSFYFSAHGKAKDIEGIAPYLADSDILLYEDTTATDESVELMNEISTKPAIGMMKISWERTKDTYGGPIVQGIKGTFKGVGNIDIGSTESERAMAKRIEGLLNVSVPHGMTYEDTLDMLRNSFSEAIALQNKREDMMIDNFEHEIDRILQSRPDLKNKEELKILISMGSYHTRLGHNFAKSGMKSRRHFPEKPYVYSYASEMQRNYTFDKTPSRDLVERAAAEILMTHAVSAINEDFKDIPYEELSHYLREVVSKLRTEDMEDLQEAYSEKYLTFKLIDKLLASRNLYRVPRDHDEMLYIIDELAHRNKRSLAKTAMRG